MPPTDADWQQILWSVRRQRCVPFLGAGASLGFENGPGLPTASELATNLAQRCDFPGADPTDFFRVTQYFRMKYDPHELRYTVSKLLRVRNVQPSAVHRVLAELPVPYVLTTNFDDLMERAFREIAEKTPSVFTYERRGNKVELPNATDKEPVVFKLHGSLDTPATMVLTEDDVVDFLACMIAGDPPIPPPVKMLFRDYSILFIGYGLKDLNVRVMLRALRGRQDTTPDITSFAIHRGPTDPPLATEWEHTVLYLRQREALRCYDMDATDFVRELKRRYDAGEGQL